MLEGGALAPKQGLEAWFFSLRILKESAVEGAIKAPATSSIFRWRIIGSVARKLGLAESL
jgi:hypothetical protein